MKKIIYTLSFLALAVSGAQAQEQAVYSHYPVFQQLVNPGYTGFTGQHEVLANVRSSWTGFPGRPNTYTLLYTAPVGDKLALGGGIFSEQIGSLSTLKLQANYAFRFQIQKAKIGLGLSTEFINRRLDSGVLSDPNIQKGDPTLERAVDGLRIFDASVGAHVLYDEKFFISLALPNTARVRLEEVPVNEPVNSGGSSSAFSHYVFQLGYILDVPSQDFKLVPSLAMRKFRDNPYQIDLNLQARFMDEKLIAGITARPSTGGSMAFMLGTKYKKMQLYYSYDVAFSRFQNYSNGSHELTAAYSFERKKPAPTPSETDLYQ